jgi:hypothetical protein
LANRHDKVVSLRAQELCTFILTVGFSFGSTTTTPGRDQTLGIPRKERILPVTNRDHVPKQPIFKAPRIPVAIVERSFDFIVTSDQTFVYKQTTPSFVKRMKFNRGKLVSLRKKE